MGDRIEKTSIRSPEQLEDAIKISTSGVWAVVILGLLALGLFFLWASLGSISTKVSSTAWVENGMGVMYVPADKMDGVDLTKEVLVDGSYYSIVSISSVAISTEDLKVSIPDEVYYRLDPAEWTYEVRFDASTSDEGLRVASVVTESVRPLSFLIKA